MDKYKNDIYIKLYEALSEENISFYGATDKKIKKALDVTKEHILNKVNKLLKGLGDENKLQIENKSSKLFDDWSSIQTILDIGFEKSDKLCDLKKQKSLKRKAETSEYLLTGPANKKLKIEKPQLYFKTLVDNTDSGPFKPKLSYKPHYIEPLEISLQLVPAEAGVPEHYKNPYSVEITKQEYNGLIYKKQDPIHYLPFNETNALFITSDEELKGMVADLKKYTELAIDLEHHDLRSYYGITCLMQISTRDQDYIIDTLVLRDELTQLNEVFCDPNIVKVLHGAFMDIIWLQRDFGLYIVSLFDTYHASRSLGFRKNSLAFLLSHYANFDADKQYQLADWRQRPLTPELLSYARSDTHFLLYIFDMLRNELLTKHKMTHVLEESRKVAMRRFENNTYRPDSLSALVYSVQDKSKPWMYLARNYYIPERWDSLVEAIFKWRDEIARKEDENPRYIMSNQFLLKLVTEKPQTASAVLATEGLITNYIKSNANFIANLIKNAVMNIQDENDPNIDKSKVHSANLDSIRVEDIINERQNFGRMIAHTSEEVVSSGNTSSALFKSVFQVPYQLWNHLSLPSSFFSSSKKLTLDDIKSREQVVEKEFKLEIKLSNPHLESLVEVVPVVEANENDESAANEVSVDEKESDGEDVVILKPHRLEQRNKSFKEKQEVESIQNQDIIPLDYTTGSKMLINHDKKRKKGNKQKTQMAAKKDFNPYEEKRIDMKEKKGKVLKGMNRKRTGSGKSISFKKR
ncbi:related to Exosome complex exonuclease RRP6 [Hanseniaspora guilliermondii]|uniref:Related to Exosome complex exonuclease RRP6 n=1 Tax=Hanseniaspora guilliermondii TaxID=56406 RepID=A0A1L0CJJ1_9ASCO|nr:related to Exosome complex exonuclease RRP6 [Hanseniaspora guilliermondii]